MTDKIVGWAKGTDPRTPEERAKLRAEGKRKVDQLKSEAKRFKKQAQRERKITELTEMGQAGNKERKRMREVHYGGQKPSAGLSYQPKGKNAARGKQSARKSAPK